MLKQLVLGICLSFPKLGSALNNYLTPLLAEQFEEEGNYRDVGMPMFVSLGAMILGLLGAFGKMPFTQSCSGSTARQRCRRGSSTSRHY